jgi:hypothetical protein
MIRNSSVFSAAMLRPPLACLLFAAPVAAYRLTWSLNHGLFGSGYDGFISFPLLFILFPLVLVAAESCIAPRSPDTGHVGAFGQDDQALRPVATCAKCTELFMRFRFQKSPYFAVPHTVNMPLASRSNSRIDKY